MKKRTFFPELIGLAVALALASQSPPTAPRPPKDIEAIRLKRAAKLARRAKRAGY